MNINLSLLEEFGPFLGDGGNALKFRITRIDPFVHLAEKIVLDFKGIRMANSSFINVIFAELEINHGKAVQKIECINCNPILQTLVESGYELGRQKAQSSTQFA